MSVADALAEVQESIASGEFEQTAFGSPEYGHILELLMCEHLGLTYVDGAHLDARDSEGRAVQIKGCRVEHSNGGDETVPGRWTAWSESLVHLLADDGMYLLAVYDGEVDPAGVDPEDLDEYVLAWRFLDAEAFGAVLADYKWTPDNRPSKGRKARPFWTDVFDETEVRDGDD